MGWLKIAQVMADRAPSNNGAVAAIYGRPEDAASALKDSENIAAKRARLELFRITALRDADAARASLQVATMSKKALEDAMIDANITQIPCDDRAPIKLVNQTTKIATRTALVEALGKIQGAQLWAKLPQKTKKTLLLPIKGAKETPNDQPQE